NAPWPKLTDYNLKYNLSLPSNMRYKSIKHILYLLAFAIPSHAVFGQTLPVSLAELEDGYRRAQLLGQLDSNISFTIRPLTNAALKQSNIYALGDIAGQQRSLIRFANGDGVLKWMPAVVGVQYNSTFPTGRNDGPVIPA